MQLTEQQLRDKANSVFLGVSPGDITAPVWSDLFTDDISDSLIPKDESGRYFPFIIGNWSEDFASLNWPIDIFKLTTLSISIAHALNIDRIMVLLFDENNILRDDSFFYWAPTDNNTITLHCYRQPDYGKFFKGIIQAI